MLGRQARGFLNGLHLQTVRGLASELDDRPGQVSLVGEARVGGQRRQRAWPTRQLPQRLDGAQLQAIAPSSCNVGTRRCLRRPYTCSVGVMRHALREVSAMYLLNAVALPMISRSPGCADLSREPSAQRIVYLSVIHSDHYCVPYFADKFGVERRSMAAISLMSVRRSWRGRRSIIRRARPPAGSNTDHHTAGKPSRTTSPSPSLLPAPITASSCAASQSPLNTPSVRSCARCSFTCRCSSSAS
jgi:hypothetical protein